MTVKILRFTHNRFGYIGIVCLLGAVAMLVWHCFRETKASRMEATENKIIERLKAYHQANGHYPDSLQILIATNSPQEIQMLADAQLINYQRTNGGYVLSYKSEDGYQSFRDESW
jgi:hypothetical protein